MSVVVVLVLIWAAVLVPPVLRSRADRRAEFIDSFREQMGALGAGRAASAPVAPPLTTGELDKPVRRVSAVQRRRDVLGGLLGAMLGALVLGAVPSLRMVWALFLFLVNVFIGYCSLLAYQRGKVLAARGVRVVRVAAPAPGPAREPRLRRARPESPTLQPALDPTS